MTDAFPSGAERERKSHLWARDPDDWYVEPRWCDDALFAAIKFEGAIVDPCCGLGRILDAAKDAGGLVSCAYQGVRRLQRYVSATDALPVWR
jgi:hypothetical protein